MHGLDILRAFEISWLDDNGKPSIACMEVCWKHGDGAACDTYALKKYLNALTNKNFSNAEIVLASIKDFFSVPPIKINFITVDDFISQDLSLKTTSLTSVISHNVRFICQHTGQPYTGSLLLECFGEDVRQQVRDKIIALRTKESNAHAYTDLLAESNCVWSVHLARKGGLSWQILRSTATDIDLWPYVQRAAVE